MKILYLLVLMVLSVECAIGAVDADRQGSLQGRGRIVEEFMSLMVERQTVCRVHRDKTAEIDRKMMALLAPYYFEALGVDRNAVVINKYSPEGFRIVSTKDDFVGVKLIRRTNAGPTYVIFKTAEYDGRYFIEPSGISLVGKEDPSLVTPWFYAAEQPAIGIEEALLPEVKRGKTAQLMPSAAENTRTEGVRLVNKLIKYLEGRNRLSVADRHQQFKAEILPILSGSYAKFSMIDLEFYEDISMEILKHPKIIESHDSYVVVSCDGCLYNRYVFKIVVEDGASKIMPTAIDNYRKTISPVWLRE